MSIAPRSPMSESFATNPPDAGESKEGYGRGRFRARFIYCGGGGGVPGLPIRGQKNAANAHTATMVTMTAATSRTVFTPPGSDGFEGGGPGDATLPHTRGVERPR